MPIYDFAWYLPLSKRYIVGKLSSMSYGFFAQSRYEVGGEWDDFFLYLYDLLKQQYGEPDEKIYVKDTRKGAKAADKNTRPGTRIWYFDEDLTITLSNEDPERYINLEITHQSRRLNDANRSSRFAQPVFIPEWINFELTREAIRAVHSPTLPHQDRKGYLLYIEEKKAGLEYSIEYLIDHAERGRLTTIICSFGWGGKGRRMVKKALAILEEQYGKPTITQKYTDAGKLKQTGELTEDDHGLRKWIFEEENITIELDDDPQELSGFHLTISRR